MAVFGIAGFVLSPTPAECPSGCRGYVYLPAVAATGISAVLAAPMGARLTHVLPVRTLRNFFALFLIMAAGNLTYKSLPVTSTANEARMLIVRLLAPDLKAAPMAAEAPSWLDVKRQMARLELAARYGPRLALLAGNAPASPPVRFLTQLVPPPDEGLEAWYHAHILKARGSLQRRSTRAELAMPLPERAIRTAGLVSYKRRAPRRKVKQQAKPSSTRSIEKRNPCNDKNLARSPRQEGGQNRIQGCETNVAAPPPAVAKPSEFDPFGLLGAPGSGGQPFSWSK
jgi:hypothetical protein